MITGLNWTIRKPRKATRVRKDANYKYTLRNLWAGRPSLVFFRLIKAQKLLLRWLALQYQALFVVPISRVRNLWQLFDALYNFFIKGTLTSESLWVAAFFTTSVEKELFYVKFHAKLTIHFGNIKSWYNYNTTMFAKYTLTNQMVLYKLKLELFEKKIHKGILHFLKCTVFLIWLWLKIVLVCKLILYHHLYSGLSSPGILDKKHGCMIEISWTCVSCKGELQRVFLCVQNFLYQFWSRS